VGRAEICLSIYLKLLWFIASIVMVIPFDENYNIGFNGLKKY